MSYLYRYTIDDVRLTLISDLQESYNMYMNIYELRCLWSKPSENSILCNFSYFGKDRGTMALTIPDKYSNFEP